jgi:Ca2+-binding EF-hand superfamily protein
LAGARGDVDGDGDVDYDDLLIFAASYGKSLGESGFDERADLNGDGKVNYQDLVILAANYGK